MCVCVCVKLYASSPQLLRCEHAYMHIFGWKLGTLCAGARTHRTVIGNRVHTYPHTHAHTPHHTHTHTPHTHTHTHTHTHIHPSIHTHTHTSIHPHTHTPHTHTHTHTSIHPHTHTHPSTHTTHLSTLNLLKEDAKDFFRGAFS